MLEETLEACLQALRLPAAHHKRLGVPRLHRHRGRSASVPLELEPFHRRVIILDTNTLVGILTVQDDARR